MSTQQQRHPVDDLFERLIEVEPYPAFMQKVDERIAGTAFFPGGYGLWMPRRDQPRPPMPIGGVMVLGHNFGTPDDHQASIDRKEEEICGSTWKPLIELLDACGIKLEQCFFTNAYMGLKDDNDSNVGKLPKDPGFMRRCQAFFLQQQLRIQQPRLLLVLGNPARAFVRPLVRDLKTAWKGKSTFPALDAANSALVPQVRFRYVAHPTAVVALLHPSMRDANLKWRSYGNLVKDPAEQALIRDALRQVGEPRLTN